MKKKGFTLIELLAVIVILAVIALIATPMIIGVIEKAKIGALKSSVDGLVESANIYYAQKQLKNEFQTTEFSCDSTGCKNENEVLEIKGKVDYGKVKIYGDGKISICVENEKNAAIKLAESDETEVKTGSCNVSGDTYTIDELVSLNKYNELKEKYDALGEENSELKAIGDATSEEIIENKKVLVNGKEIVGTMTNNGSVNETLSINGTYTIPKGYHDGTGKVTQTITTKAAATYTPGTSNQTIAAGQYLSEAQTIVGDADLKSANIKSGVNIFGVAGNSNVVDTSSGDATAAQILSGKKAYVDGKLVTGTIASLAAKTYTPSTSNQTIASGQYLSGTQTIAGDADLKSANIKSGVNIFGVAGNSNVVDTSSGDATAAQILSGKKAYVDGKLVTGTRTAQNNTYTVFKHVVDNHLDQASTVSLSYTATAKGKVIIYLGFNASNGDIGSVMSYSVTKNGTALTKSGGYTSAWTATAYFTINVNSGDVITAKGDLPASSGKNGIALFGVFVS